ncbi:MAG: hypothetical protein ACREAC_19635 [Blastocatellia bacterium]
MMGRFAKHIPAVAVLSICLCFGLGAADSPTSPSDSQQVIAFLNQAIDWYRHLTVEEQLADQPSDVLFVYNSHQTADDVLSLSFEFARAEAQILGKAATGKPAAPGAEAHYQNLSQLASTIDADVQQKQQSLNSLKRKLDSARGRARTAVEAQVADAQSDLDLAQTRSATLHSLLQFVAGTGGNEKGGGLMSQIDELERSVPEVRVRSVARSSGSQQNAQNNGTAPLTLPAARKAPPSGVVGLSEDLFSIRSKIHTLDSIMDLTNSLAHSSRALIAPLGTTLTSAAKQGDDLANQPDSNDPKVMAQRKQQIDALQIQFKQVAAAALPLAKQGILLDRYNENLTRWRTTLQSQRTSDFGRLAVRLVGLGIVLLIAIGIFEVWRWLTYHYVHEVRRRNQFLLLRRIIMFFVLAIIIAFGFSTDLGSLTTFAGLLVAGLAVSFQSVLLSAVGYFVLLGKYGVRVGDRIQISGVVGNVVDIDLMRLSLMELGETSMGNDVPTGRTVEFPNAIVFQPTAGLFKQIPGANFQWHEVTLTLSTESDYHAVERRMLDSVNKVFATYRDKLEEQHRRMERSVNLSIDAPRPMTRMRFTQSGIEVVIRYPVTRENAADVDDRITHALLEVMGKESAVKAVGTPSQSNEPVLASNAAPSQLAGNMPESKLQKP